MKSPNETFVKRENPQLAAALEVAKETVRPVVEALGHIASMDGAVLFIRDTHYAASAATVAAINRNTVGNGRFAFQDANITGRRVDLLSTAVGDTFHSKRSEYAASKMNPKQHIVWGAPVDGLENDAVFQFAFSREYGELPDERQLRDEWKKQKSAISAATASLLNTAPSQTSISDELLLDVPSTPNAYVLNWDLNNSTTLAATNYPMLRHYLTQASIRYERIVAHAGGQLIDSAGDGQSFRFQLPYPDVDRNDVYQVGRYGRTAVLPTIFEIEKHHQKLAERYRPYIQGIRIGVELGCYEATTIGESSPSLWSIARDMDALPRSSSAVSIGKAARHALDVFEALDKKR